MHVTAIQCIERPYTKLLDTAYLTQYLHESRHLARLCISVHSWEVYLRFDLPRELQVHMHNTRALHEATAVVDIYV